MNERTVINVKKFGTGLDLNTDLHGNEVEYPGGIAHLLR